MRNITVTLIIGAFLASSFGPLPAQAQELSLPKPGTMVYLSPAFNAVILKGIKVHPENPFRFDFILDQGDEVPDTPAGGRDANRSLKKAQLLAESTRLIKYFLASLTIPEKDLWVNLSPYEKDRIVPEAFGQTEMGRDLLAQDYLLKQITASLIYPEDEIGKKFWKRVYEEASKKFGTTNIPVNTFNKVWIVPEKAVVYENVQVGTAYVVESRLKVMLEEDYLALEKNELSPTLSLTKRGGQSDPPSLFSKRGLGGVADDIVREVVIPELTKEINDGKNFAQLRQVYNSLILATWYKKKIKDSILTQVYVDKNKVVGVNIDNPQEKQKIYERYLQAFKKGAYNYIKEDIDPATQRIVPRKYFSGGLNLAMTASNFGATKLETTSDMSSVSQNRDEKVVRIILTPDAAMLNTRAFFGQVWGSPPIALKKPVPKKGSNVPGSSRNNEPVIDSDQLHSKWTDLPTDTQDLIRQFGVEIFYESIKTLIRNAGWGLDKPFRSKYELTAYSFYNNGLPAVKNLITDKESFIRVINELVNIGGEAGDNAVYLFRTLAQTQVQRLITDEASFKRIGRELAKRFKEAGILGDALLENYKSAYWFIKNEERFTVVSSQAAKMIRRFDTRDDGVLWRDVFRRIAERDLPDTIFVKALPILADACVKNEEFIQLLQSGIISRAKAAIGEDFFNEHWAIILEKLFASDQDADSVAKIIKTVVFLNKTSPPKTLSDESKEVIARASLLSQAGLPLLDPLLYSTHSPALLSAIARHIRQGNMDVYDDLHIALNYFNYTQDFANAGRTTTWPMTYKEFQHLFVRLRGASQSQKESDAISDAVEIQMRGLAVEAFPIWKEILAQQARSHKAGRPLIVVANESYGPVALAPITIRRNGRKYLLGTDIPIISTKIGSTESHHNEFVLEYKEPLFTEADLISFILYKPDIMVIDGSSSVGTLTPRIPSAFKGYRNVLIALTIALVGQVKPEDFHVDEKFLSDLQNDPSFKRLTARIKELVNAYPSQKGNGYKFGFWYPGKKVHNMYVAPSRVAPAPNTNELTAEGKTQETKAGPRMIFMQSGIEPESIDRVIRTDFIKGNPEPVFFDDTNNFIQFFYDFSDKYGISPFRKYDDLSAQIFYDLLDFLNKNKPNDSFLASLPSNREVEALIFDLDDTLAKFGKAPSPYAVQRLLNMLAKGKKFVLVTDALEEEIDRRLASFISKIPNESLSQIFIFTNGATTGYTYDTLRNKVYLEGYNQKSVISETTLNTIQNIIEDSFPKDVKMETRAERLIPDLRIDLTTAGESRVEIIPRLRDLLSRNSIMAKVYKTGRRGIRIVLQHKEDATLYFLQNQNVPAARALIMADQAGKDEMDEVLLSRFREAMSINVGPYFSETPRSNPRIVQLGDHVDSVHRWLDILDRRGVIPGSFLMKPLSDRTNAAMIGHMPGGIDFNSSKMNLETKTASRFSGDNQGIQFHIDPSMMKELQNSSGFLPVVIDIQPLLNINDFLGVPQAPN